MRALTGFCGKVARCFRLVILFLLQFLYNYGTGKPESFQFTPIPFFL